MIPRAAVVGAGPAGCAAAVELGAAGISTVLLERGAPGKDKPCGDGIVPAALDRLAALGLGDAELEALGGRRAGACWTVPRARLDQRLRDRAAQTAELRHGARAASLRVRDAGGIELDAGRGPEVFDAVVLAEGADGPLARSLGLGGDPDASVAISGYEAAAAAPETLEFRDTAYGYEWTFPMDGERANVGVFVRAPRTAEASALFRALTPARARGGSLPLWSGRARAWHHPAGILVCGDAAGLAHPKTGEGISAALESGAAAGLAAAAFARGDAGAPAVYTSWLRKRCEARYTAAPPPRTSK